MPRLDKRGKITIPSHVRKSLGLFPGIKAEVSYTNNKIIITPYNYQCKECGIEIPEGTLELHCKNCEKKYIHDIY